jgi:hypothetical protein
MNRRAEERRLRAYARAAGERGDSIEDCRGADACHSTQVDPPNL